MTDGQGSLPAGWTTRAAAIAGCVVALSSVAAHGQDRLVIVAGKIVTPDGKLVDNQGIVVSSGKIEKVAPSDQLSPASANNGTYLKLDKAVVCPGLIDLDSSAGAWGNNVERFKSVDPNANVIDSIDPADPALAKLLHDGITAIMVTPRESNVVAGTAATVRTYAKDSKLDVVRSDGPMVFALGQAVLSGDREPTSRSGAVRLLREAMTDAKAGKGNEALKRVIDKKEDAILDCSIAEDVDAGMRLFSELGISPTLVHTADAVQIAGDWATANTTTVVGPLLFTSHERSLAGPAAVAKAGGEVAFSGGTPVVEGAGLRTTAALAVRYGLDPAAARRGFTANAAKVAGVADKTGSLAAGKDADFVIFSGDPLRLDSKVLAVYVKGVRVYSAPASGEAAGAGGSYEDQDN